MIRVPVIGLISLSFILSALAVGRAGEEKAKTKDDDKFAEQRLELMQRHMSAVQVTSEEAGFPAAYPAKPIFRYTDPARGYVAAAVWKLGDEGRPRALTTVELYKLLMGQPKIAYEHLSLTQTHFSAKSDEVHWAPEGTLLEFKPVPDAPAPEETPQKRLLQMRAIAKRFAGSEHGGNYKTELRLLPQPVDRYAPSSSARADGGMFLLVVGTNPEIVLLLESDGKTWNYGAGRMTAAYPLVLTIDGEPAWEATPRKSAVNAPYTSSNAPADIPGIARDGSEIKE